MTLMQVYSTHRDLGINCYRNKLEVYESKHKTLL